jgi:hypothetical protein
VWYDDELTLGAKYRACRSYGVRGVAMWTAGGLEYGQAQASKCRTTRMWGAIREFSNPSDETTVPIKTDEVATPSSDRTVD